MIEWMHPAFIFIIGALFIPFLDGRIKKAYMLILPFLAFMDTFAMSEGTYWVYNFLGNNLVFGRVDRLSLVFSYIFTIMQFTGMLYALHVEDDRQHMAAFFYAGSSLGAVFAGDYLTLFIFWEIMALSASYLVFAKRGGDALDAGFRYILVHIFGGACLLAGIVIHYALTGSLVFVHAQNATLASYLVLTGFLVCAAAPPLGAWLPDSYPEATITGAVFMSAFTTKTAVYALIRAFPGQPLLIWIGVIMAVYGIIYAMMENDMRRLLSYHIISQAGYMVAGVGIGTELALNGAAAHAFANIIYKGLLFMGTGAVIYATGKRKITELGGLYEKMPVTFVLYIIGGVSISAFPLFLGFISKSMVIGAAGEKGLSIVTLLLMLASSGTLLSTTLKLPYHVFFGEKKGISEAKEPPLNMIFAMAFAAFLCISIGIFPSILYNILPYPVSFEPYALNHVTGTLGMLAFTGLGFLVLLKKFRPEPAVSVDTDWFYRRGSDYLVLFLYRPIKRLGAAAGKTAFDFIPSFLAHITKNPLAELKIAGDTFLFILSGKNIRPRIKERIREEKALYPGDIIKHWPIGSTVLWVTLFLLASLFIYYL